MKLRHKKTGKVLKLDINCIGGKVYNTLAELNEEWEDYEPVTFWFIGEDSYPHEENDTVTRDFVYRLKAIGNYFGSEEQAERAIEKLKAWKRLKDHNLVIKKCERMYTNTNEVYTTQAVEFKVDTYGDIDEDLDLLFGGEDE